MERDPFETAANDAFRDADAADANLGPKPADELSLGRDGEMPSKTQPRSVPSSRRTGTPRPDPSLGTDRAASNEPSDYVGDYPVGVPRWDEGDANRDNGPISDDPEGKRFEKGGAFSNEPGWFEPGPKNAQLCYWLNVGGFVFGFLPIVGAVMALINRSKVGPELATHYTYSMRTLLLALLYGFGLVLLLPPDLFGLAMLAVVIWFGWRNLRGLARLGTGRPMPNPRTWTV